LSLSLSYFICLLLLLFDDEDDEELLLLLVFNEEDFLLKLIEIELFPIDLDEIELEASKDFDELLVYFHFIN